MESVDIEDPHLALCLSSFILERCDRVHGPVQFQLCSARQDDGSLLKTCSGVGTTTFSHDGHAFAFVRERVGVPLSSGNGSCVHQAVRLRGESLDQLKRLCAQAIEDEDPDMQDRFRTYAWDSQHEFWKRQSRMHPRPWESVILEPKVRARLEEELRAFTDPATRDWYHRMGVPYRRGILLHGPPGSGKTSTVAAIATWLRRNVYRLTPDRRMTDDALHQAVCNVRNDKAIVVLEDVDCLFDLHREKRSNDCALSFSGLLNALDGLQDPCGTLFVFTTNHADRLDPALRRKGRIDLEVELSHCSRWQARAMFERFYPDASEKEAETFASAALAACPTGLSTATLQDFFVRMRDETAAHAAAHVDFGRSGDGTSSSMFV